jgi:hypothetical protein
MFDPDRASGTAWFRRNMEDLLSLPRKGAQDRYEESEKLRVHVFS